VGDRLGILAYELREWGRMGSWRADKLRNRGGGIAQLRVGGTRLGWEKRYEVTVMKSLLSIFALSAVILCTGTGCRTVVHDDHGRHDRDRHDRRDNHDGRNDGRQSDYRRDSDRTVVVDSRRPGYRAHRDSAVVVRTY
jgi:hypothetical protein